ncbi:MAG TPA: GntR family transcriptional regulator, partial [Thermomicrobiales bacterium]|nr:GntR family transcriptional regulator [Thermomicrobiales bacterium]
MSHRTSDDLPLEDRGTARGSFAATPVDARKRADQVRDKIVEMIREGYLQEGEKLPTEPQLSEMFGVGRSSVREAVQALIGLGVVEMRSGRGA